MENFIFKATEGYVKNEHGISIWSKVIDSINLKNDDLTTEDIVDSQVLDSIIDLLCSSFCQSKEELLENIGRHHFKQYFESGYKSILYCVGPDLPVYLTTFDQIYEHLGYPSADQKMPSLSITYKKDFPNGFFVQYHSSQSIMQFIIAGYIKAVAEILFEHEVDVNLVSNCGVKDCLLAVTMPHKRANQISGRSKLFPDEDTAIGLENVIDNETFIDMFPFHILLNRDLIISQAGTALHHLLPDLQPGVTCFNKYFAVIQPAIPLSFNGILSQTNSIFHVETRALTASSPYVSAFGAFGKDVSSLRLRGQMMYLKESDSMIFFSSPNVVTLDGLLEEGIYLSDIPIHDATRDLILLSEQHTAEKELKNKLQSLTDELEQTASELQYEQKLADQLLYSILPPSVADDLRAKRSVAAKKYEMVTIMFSGIADFSLLCNNSNDPMEIVDTLNNMYTAFDQITDENDEIYKVETVGDKYMCASGLPNVTEHHAINIAKLALDMISIAKGFMIGKNNVTVTIGIHSGEVVAGVIGRKLPRYCLFGNAVNLTSRTETTGVKGRINLTEFTYRDLCKDRDSNFKFESRGPVIMKGIKEPINCYILSAHLDS